MVWTVGDAGPYNLNDNLPLWWGECGVFIIGTPHSSADKAAATNT